MDVYSTELGIRIRFVKTLEFRGVGVRVLNTPKPLPAYATAHTHQTIQQHSSDHNSTHSISQLTALPKFTDSVTVLVLSVRLISTD
jgi:hypothetical protein